RRSVDNKYLAIARCPCQPLQLSWDGNRYFKIQRRTRICGPFRPVHCSPLTVKIYQLYYTSLGCEGATEIDRSSCFSDATFSVDDSYNHDISSMHHTVNVKLYYGLCCMYSYSTKL